MHTTTSTIPAYTLELRQRLTAVQNRYDVVTTRPDGTEQVLAYVEQRRFALKERVSFYTEDTMRQVAFTIGARNVVELAGTYGVGTAPEPLRAARPRAGELVRARPAGSRPVRQRRLRSLCGTADGRPRRLT